MYFNLSLPSELFPFLQEQTVVVPVLKNAVVHLLVTLILFLSTVNFLKF